MPQTETSKVLPTSCHDNKKDPATVKREGLFYVIQQSAQGPMASMKLPPQG